MTMRRLACASSIVVSLLGLGVGGTQALETGIFDAARAGCGCHGGIVPPNTTTQPVILGLPAAGYVPGQTYDLTLWVLGARVPVGSSAVAGFNVQATAGLLEKLDDTIQTRLWGECDVMSSVRGCSPPESCGVRMADPDTTCRDAVECYPRYCSTPGEGDCRACRPEIFDIQATHTLSGNDQAMWNVRWTAPSPGVGDVTFYMGGNSVDGDGANSVTDLWSVMIPRAVPQAQ